MSEAVAARLAAVRERIARAAERAGRGAEVELVGVAKLHPAADVVDAVLAGLGSVGESYAQEAKAKVPEVARRLAAAGRLPPRWHFVGRLQTNKVRKALEAFNAFHSVDRLDLALELDKRASHQVSSFVQVNVSGESTKSGFAPDDLEEGLSRIRAMKRVALEGLMTMAPAGADARPHFRRLRELAARHGLPGLSMGMSADFEAAVEEGATHVRVGSGLFEGLEPG